MTAAIPIIVADDDRSVRLVITKALTRQGYRVHPAATAASMWDLVSAGRGQILITDVGFPDGDALDMLPRLQTKQPSMKIIVMSARANLLTAVKAQKQHVFDYLPKPFDLRALLDVTQRAALDGDTVLSDARDNVSSHLHLPEEVALPLIGRSEAMQTSFKLLARFAAQRIPILILAEAGTGKQDVARTIHDMEPANKQAKDKPPFVSVQLSKIPPEEHEAQLFADDGGFAKAARGTIFINDINLLRPDAQMRLARALEQPELLAGRPNRIICGSQVDLKLLVEQGAFRGDLYFIISAALLRLPPLRERLEDVPALVLAITSALGREFDVVRDVDRAALAVLQTYSWPRNVRELEFLLRRLFVKSSNNLISVAEIEAELSELAADDIQKSSESLAAGESLASGESLGSSALHHIRRFYTALGADLPPPGLYDRIIQEVEKPLIYTTLYRTGGNQLKAAEILGLNRNTLRKKMKLLNLSSNRAEYRK